MYISDELENRVSRKHNLGVTAIFDCSPEKISISGDFLSIYVGENFILKFATKNTSVFKILESKSVLTIINDGNIKYVLEIISIEIEKEQNYKVTIEAYSHEKEVI